MLTLPYAEFGEGKTALKFRLRVKVGGHNNIKLNPVFRGMLR